MPQLHRDDLHTELTRGFSICRKRSAPLPGACFSNIRHLHCTSSLRSRPHRIGHRPNAVKLSPSCPLSQAQLNRQPTDKARIIPVGERWHVASWLRDEVPSRLWSVDSVHACVLQVEILPLMCQAKSKSSVGFGLLVCFRVAPPHSVFQPCGLGCFSSWWLHAHLGLLLKLQY